MTLAIRDWHQHFHYEAAKKHERVSWRRHPVSHASKRYKILMETAEGRAAYCVFLVILDLCAVAKSDGVLIDDQGHEIGPKEVSRASCIPMSICNKAFRLLQSDQFRWLVDYSSISNRSEIDEKSTDDRSEIDSEQSRAEQSREEKTKAMQSTATDSSASQSRPALPSQIHTPEFVLSCLTSEGISPADAHAMIADATRLFPADGLARLVKGAARLNAKRKKLAAKGEAVASPVQFVMVAGEIKKSVKQQAAAAKANVAAQAKAARERGAA